MVIISFFPLVKAEKKRSAQNTYSNFELSHDIFFNKKEHKNKIYDNVQLQFIRQ